MLNPATNLASLFVTSPEGGATPGQLALPTEEALADEIEFELRGKMIDRRFSLWEWQQMAPRIQEGWGRGAAIGLRRFLDEASLRRPDWVIDAEVLSELSNGQGKGLESESLKILSDRVARPDLLPKHSSVPFRLTTKEWSPIRQHPFEISLFEEFKKRGLVFNERDSSIQLWNKGDQFVARLWLVFDNNQNLSDGAWVVEQFVSLPHGWSDPETLPTEFYEYPHFVWGTTAVQEADCTDPGSWIADKSPDEPDLKLTCYQWSAKASKVQDKLAPRDPWLMERRDKKKEAADFFRSTLVNLLGEPKDPAKVTSPKGGLLPRVSKVVGKSTPKSKEPTFSKETFRPLPEISYQSGLGYPSGIFTIGPTIWRQFLGLSVDQQIKLMTGMPSPQRNALLGMIVDEEPERAAFFREQFNTDKGS